MSETVIAIKHMFNGPFIPLAILPVAKVKKLDPIMICKKDKKALNEMGIFKDQKINIDLENINLISFYDDQIKQKRYISLPSKLMKYFKEVT